MILTSRSLLYRLSIQSATEASNNNNNKREKIYMNFDSSKEVLLQMYNHKFTLSKLKELKNF